jgi:acyl-CoA thioesterase-1
MFLRFMNNISFVKNLLAVLFAWFLLTNHVSAQDDKNLMILGDSISAGYGVETKKQWTKILQKKLDEAQLNLQIINTSVSGDTTGGGVSRIESLLQNFSPDILLIELGGNDALRGYPVQTIQANLKKIALIANQQNIRVLLMQIKIPPNYGRRYVEAFEAIYVNLGNEENISLFPFMLEPVALNDDFMLPDGIHPNEKAQAVIADFMYKNLKVFIED